MTMPPTKHKPKIFYIYFNCHDKPVRKDIPTLQINVSTVLLPEYRWDLNLGSSLAPQSNH